MNILITGSRGFIGKNLIDHLKNLRGHNILEFNRGDSDEFLFNQIQVSDLIIHLAGANRPMDTDEFQSCNVDLTKKICGRIAELNKKLPVIFSSSTQAQQSTEYGSSKLVAEYALIDLHKRTGNPIKIFRLPGVFGKYCKPNYNSVVATFCHNIANNLPIEVIDPQKIIPLIYIDDLIHRLLSLMAQPLLGLDYITVEPEHRIQIGDLARILYEFKNSETTLTIDEVGSGFLKALYATYLSYLNPKQFAYPLVSHNDFRGSFVEVIKTKNSGQFSYLTAEPGITRGGHYHHTKCEKFVAIQGIAKFCFKHTITQEQYEFIASGNNPTIVQTVPGWAHDITNIGTDDLLVIIWSNEVFDPNAPDTTAYDLKK